MADENKTEEQEQSSKKTFTFRKFLILGVPFLIIQLFLAYWIMSKFVSPQMKKGTKLPKIRKKQIQIMSSKEMGKIYKFEDIIVNPVTSNTMRFVNVSIALDCKNSSILKEVEKRDIKIRDYLISLFSDCAIEEINSKEDKDSLRVQIITDVNSILPKRGIQGVYFTNFVIQ